MIVSRPTSCYTSLGRFPFFEAVEPRLLLSGGTITGYAWSDLDGDGKLEPGEPLLSGWGIYIDANHNSRFDAGEITTSTGADGMYQFNDLAPGNYLIGQILKSGWKSTFPSASTAGTFSDLPPTSSIVPAISQASDLSQYDPGQLDAATGWVIGLGSQANIASVVSASGAIGELPTGVIPDTYTLTFNSGLSGSQIAARLSQAAGLSFFYPLVPRAQEGRAIPNDPLFPQQWYLLNNLPSGNLPGSDADVVAAWDKYQGSGVKVAVVDDGVQYTHPDLAANYDAFDSFDFDSNDPDPISTGRDKHGTAVAGIIAARGNNGIGISGIAPQVSMAAIRLTDTDTTDQQEAAALSYHAKTPNPISIYSNSWGPADDGLRLEGPGPMTLAAMKDSVTNGRGGRGSIYVWAAGNGLQENDNVNYDGYANSRYVIATTALDEAGVQAYYAEPGAPIFIAASGAGDTPGMMTTDLRGTAGFNSGPSVNAYTNDYYNDFGGTSASAPLVAGAVALMLQANPNLTWRDVKHILADTAQKNDPSDSGWTVNGAGHWINNKYGFGALDASAAVQAAVNWTSVGPEAVATSGDIDVDKTIPDEDRTGVTSSVTIDRLIRMESVEVVFNATHPTRGDLRVVLTSPDGTQSVLAETHDDRNADYDHWTFTTNRDWDEISKGAWTLTVTDEEGGSVGTWDSWRINIYGTALTNEQYVSLADGAVVKGVNFGARPLAGPRVVLSGLFTQSGPMRLLFSFDKDVSSVTADDLELKNDTTGQTIPTSLMRVDYSTGSRSAVWTFPGFAHGILPDGNYTARLKAANISTPGGGMLDGNNDGIGGDDFITTFFQLLGDANRDRKVDSTDLKILLSHLGSNSAAPEQGDLTYDGKVDFHDFQAMEIAFGHALSAPVTQPGQTAPALASKPVAILKPAPIAPADSLFSTRPIRRRNMDLLDTPAQA